MSYDNVPKEYKDELEPLGLSIGGTIGNNEEIHVILTSWFQQKGNQRIIKSLERLGWTKDEGRITGGVKYLKYRKELKVYCKQIKWEV